MKDKYIRALTEFVEGRATADDFDTFISQLYRDADVLRPGDEYDALMQVLVQLGARPGLDQPTHRGAPDETEISERARRALEAILGGAAS